MPALAEAFLHGLNIRKELQLLPNGKLIFKCQTVPAHSLFQADAEAAEIWLAIPAKGHR